MENWAGHVSRRLKEADSTNKQARLWAREGAPHGAIVIAGRQTAGRGRLGRAWASEGGMGLWLSIIIRPQVPIASYPLLSFAMALAAADACAALSGGEIYIKWPNDLLLCGRKIVGILAEMEGTAAIVGVGVNLRQQAEDFPPELRETAGSLRMLTGRDVPPDALERALLDGLERRVDAWDFMDEYRARCSTVGAQVRVIEQETTWDGLATGVDADGVLLVRDDAGTVRRVLAGDVSIRKV